jgi:transcriptional regulator of heat shock response
MTEQEGFGEENLEETSQEEETLEESNPLEDRLGKLESMLSQLLTSQAPKEEPKKERMSFSKEQLAALKDNPELMVQFIEEKTNSAIQGVSKQVETQRWDEKAEKDFPALTYDKKFQEAVTKKIQELVQFGKVPKDSPTLLYTAAELAAAKYQPKTQSEPKKTDTSALKPGAKKPVNVPNEKLKQEFEQKTYLLRAAGYPEDKIKKMLEKYESSGVERTTRSGLRRRVTHL